MSNPESIVNEDYGYAVSLPTTTPNGQKVTILSGEHSGVHILHAESPDQSELYFEVAAYQAILDHAALVKEQQEHLGAQSADGKLTEMTWETLASHTGTTFDFGGTLQGRWKERRFLFLDGLSRTYRVVYDPTSPLNVQTLRALKLIGRASAEHGT